MTIIYAHEPDLPSEAFRDILIASTLALRRPVDDLARLEKMLRNADIIITARHDGKLVGISRAITDLAFSCYLSDLAVDQGYQHQGIGKRLIEETHQSAGPQTTLYLVSAPAAEAYYPKIGMTHVASCWMLPRLQTS
ncbi:MAG: GNAT family N-acetyltransferase [Prosthecobacter sp.]|nr:GNAT family N-acetyltransferase [Prosthecobacter sp.]